MSSKGLTTSINMLGDYSVGASPIDYMMRCARKSYISNWLDLPYQPFRDASGGLMFAWRYDVSGDEIAHIMSVRNPETSPETQDSESLQYRVACHYLVDLVADEGLPELLECLKDNLEFYKAHQTNERPQLVGGTGIRVKVGKKYDRPIFQLAQE
jgi:hypothetical protein